MRAEKAGVTSETGSDGTGRMPSRGGMPNIYDAVTRFPSARFIFAWTALVCCALFASRLLGPETIMDDDQQRPTAYVMDVLHNGNWLAQHDQSGDVMSKPPFSTWVTAAIAAPFDRLSYFLLFLPCALATLATTWLIVGYGNRHFGRGPALFGATAYLLSMIAFKQVALVRTDSMFTVTVFLGAVVAYRAWTRQSGWTLFWLVAVASTLVKGPLGPLLSLGGLGAYWWEKRSGSQRPLRGSHAVGVALFLALALGWFLLAYHELGRSLIDKLIGRELVGHAVRSDKGKPPLVEFYVPTLYYLTRYAPWSFLSLAAFWRVWRRPAMLDDERRFERFLFCYFFFGLVLFSLAPHHRADHLWPLIPAAALLTGREIALWWRHRPKLHLYACLTAALALFLIIANVYLHRVRTIDEKILETGRVRDFAAFLRGEVGGAFPLMHVDSPFGLQFYLGTMHQNVSATNAAAALSGSGDAFAVVEDVEALRKKLLPNRPLYDLVQWKIGKTSLLHVISNHPRLEYTPQMTTVVSPVRIEMTGLHLARTSGNTLVFWSRQPHGTLFLTNVTSQPQKIRVRVENLGVPYDRTLRLEPSGSWNEDFGRERGPDKPLRVAQLADCRGAFAQLAALGRARAFAGIDYLFVNGDFVFEADWHYDIFLSQARRLGLPVYPVLGNHDLVLSSSAPEASFMNRFGYNHYAFGDGTGYFVMLDSARGELGKGQLDYLAEALKGAKPWHNSIIFQHVPPEELGARRMAHFGASGEKNEAARLLAVAAQGRAARIYSAHVNGLKTTDYPTTAGKVRGVTSSGGGEKAGEKEYRQHWLEIKIGTDRKVEEIAHDIPAPTLWERLKCHLWFKDLPMLIRYLPRVMVFVLIALFFLAASWRGMHHARVTKR